MQALAIAITDNSAIVGYIGNGQNHTAKHIEARRFYRVRDAATAMQIARENHPAWNVDAKYGMEIVNAHPV